jgi:hypothetical protein
MDEEWLKKKLKDTLWCLVSLLIYKRKRETFYIEKSELT